MSEVREVKRTKKDTFAPFVKMMIAKDKKYKTSFVPKGLNTNSKKKDLENFFNLMENRFNLMDMTVSQAKQNKFLSNLQRQRKEELEALPKNAPNVDRFKSVLSSILAPQVTPKTKYQIRMKHEYEMEFKNKEGSQSGKVYKKTDFQTREIIARNREELDLIFEREYGNEAMSGENSDSFTICLEASYQILDAEKIKQASRQEQIQLMKAGSIILSKEWLQYAKGVSEKAFDETENKCCYHQLSYILNNAPSGKNQQYIGHRGKNQKTDPNGIYMLFEKYARTKSEIYPEFSMSSGVSTEMIIHLCETLGRSCYAYNGDDKCFAKYIHTNSNYCPIAFYKYNGHMFLIDERSMFKNIAESNKPNIKIITSLVEKETKENKDVTLETEFIEEVNIKTVKELPSRFYVINKSQIMDEFKEYILTYHTQPFVKCKEGRVVYISFDNIQKERIVIACDANYGKVAMDKIGYEKLQEECSRNGIKYMNQGIGSIVNQLIDRFDGIEKRQYLSNDDKALVKSRSNGLCAECHLKCKCYEYDHIISLSNGGSNAIENFQILCKDCHLKKTTEEQQDGSQKILSKIHSSFNNLVLEQIVDTIYFKSYQFVEMMRAESKDTSFKIDMRKCRRNVLYHSKYEFPVYSVMDYPQHFSGSLKCGYFYVKTSHSFPLRGSGWYCEALVDYCLRKNIIKLDDIRFEFIPSNKLSPNYFQEKIDFILNSFQDTQLQKLAINAMIGCWGIQKKKSTHMKFSLAEDEASQWFVDNNNVFITSHKLGDQTLFEGCYENEIAVDDNAYPLYSMVLQLEAMELHQLESLIVDNGGTPLERNTDAIRYEAKTEIDISVYFWDNAKTKPKYQAEENTPLKCETKPHWIRENNLKYDDFDIEWNRHNKIVKEVFDMKKSMMINGRAGVGKTYFVNELITLIKESGKKYECLAPTNKSARLINGITLDSLNYKSIFNNDSIVRWAKSIDYLVVDEISMVKEKFYRLLTNIKKINPRIIFYICGDFDQLEPVNDTWNGDYENSAVLKDLCQRNKLVLTQCRRSDEVLFNLCKNLHLVNLDEFSITRETNLNVAFTHETRKKVNHSCMMRNLQSSNSEPISIPADENNPKTQDIHLIRGMPIICHRTNKKIEILNSDRFVITSINNKTIEFTNELRIEKEQDPIRLELKDFNKYFYLAYCITVHASQGETFKEPYTIYDWSRMSKKGKYVALSRGTEKDNIQIY